MAEHDGARIGNLIVEELTKVFHIHPTLLGIHHGDKARELQAILPHVANSANYVRELAHARGLDEDAIGVIGIQHFHERLAEIPHQTATNTARVHFGHVDARLSEKPAVNADLAEFVFDQHQSLARICLGDQLFDQRGFTRAQKSRENINFGHGSSPLKFRLHVEGLLGCVGRIAQRVKRQLLLLS